MLGVLPGHRATKQSENLSLGSLTAEPAHPP